jgi:mxaJ protein
MCVPARHARPLALRLVAATALLGAACAGGAAQPPLRVCADPNNLPFSNRARDGFENRIAELLAADRHATLEYTWWAQRRGFVRNTLAAGTCDVVIGVPRDSASVATTLPYYRSSYVFVSRRDRGLNLDSFDDPRLSTLRIGVQMIGDDFANTPPAHALARRGMTGNVVGYTVYGDYGRPSPLSEIVTAVDRGEVDAAVVWGPAAGFFARHSDGRLALSAVSPQRDSPSLPFAFEISMGVRRGDAALRTELDDFLMRRHVEIDAILDEYGIPRVDGL